jgi:hypothetical protein
MAWTDKPNMISDPVEGPFFAIQSPDGSKILPLGLTNEGVLTVDDVPLNTESSTSDVPVYDSNGNLISLTSMNGSQKVKEELLTYSGGKITQLVTKYYDSSEVLNKTITEDITYKGNGQVLSITKTVT